MKSVQNKQAVKNLHTRGFSLIEMLVVMAIISILLVTAVPLFTNNTNSARQASREIIKAHLQQARSHAIATGNATALVIPDQASNTELGARSLSLVEVENTAGSYVPMKNDTDQDLLLQRFEKLSGSFRFLTSAQVSISNPTALDGTDKLPVTFGGRSFSCHMIVFAPSGQIVRPASGTPINLAIGQAVNRGGSVILTDKNGGRPVFDLIQVNRLTGRTRLIEP